MLDFERLAKDYRIPVLLGSGHHHCRTGWTQTHCPICSGGHEGWHLGFSQEQGNFHCWRCGGLKTVDVLCGLIRTFRKEDIHKLIRKYQKKGPNQTAQKEEVERNDSIDPPPGTGPLGLLHRRYLRNRGFSPKRLVEEWNLQGTRHLSGSWNWRIIIPIYDITGRVVAYAGRAIGADAQPRYKMSDDEDMIVKPASLLYGIHRVQGDTVLIVEGPTGVFRLGPGTVATLSTNWHKEQVAQLRKYRRRFVLYDPEAKAQQRAEALAKALSVFDGVTEILSGFDTDPGDMTEEEARQVRQEIGL